jgi:hypothetical protein
MSVTAISWFYSDMAEWFLSGLGYKPALYRKTHRLRDAKHSVKPSPIFE